MPVTIVIFGASGDLTQRKLVPALFSLYRKGRLPANTRIVGFARRPWSHDEFRAQLRAGAQQLGYRHMDIVSGAGHDAVYIAGVAPTAMIFVPCEGGISHNEIENAKPEDLAAGCNVLLQAVLAQAGV